MWQGLTCTDVRLLSVCIYSALCIILHFVVVPLITVAALDLIESSIQYSVHEPYIALQNMNISEFLKSIWLWRVSVKAWNVS